MISIDLILIIIALKIKTLFDIHCHINDHILCVFNPRPLASPIYITPSASFVMGVIHL